MKTAVPDLGLFVGLLVLIGIFGTVWWMLIPILLVLAFTARRSYVRWLKEQDQAWYHENGLVRTAWSSDRSTTGKSISQSGDCHDRYPS